MLETLQQESFLVGATLVVVYQAAKFTELNLADPVTKRYVALLPDAKVRDFASSWAYHTALFTFLGVSLVVYFLLCQISPDVFKGAAGILGAAEPSAALKGVPYPLYIAALFVGLTQPIIPIFSQFVNAQRDFFHDRINIPRRLIDLSDFLTHAIELRSGADKRSLANEVRNLASGAFVTRLQNYGDGAYYNLQLEKLELGDEDALTRTIKGSSAKELRGLIERLVLCALVAVMRRSGPNSLTKIAEALDAPVPPGPTKGNVGYFIASFVSSTVLLTLALLILAHVFWLLVGPVARLFPDQLLRLWPEDLANTVEELRYIVPPIFVSLLVAVFFLVPHDRSQARDIEMKSGDSLGAEFVDFFRSSAVVLGMCIGITVLIQTGQFLYELGVNAPRTPRTVSQLILPVIQAFIPVAVCLFTTWYLVSSSARPPRPGLSFTATVLAIVAATALVGFIYELTFVHDYLHRYPDAAPGWDHVLFGVVANVLVSVCAFASIAVFFTTRERLPEAVRAHQERSEAAPASDPAPEPPRRGLRNIYRRANVSLDASQHVSQ